MLASSYIHYGANGGQTSATLILGAYVTKITGDPKIIVKLPEWQSGSSKSISAYLKTAEDTILMALICCSYILMFIPLSILRKLIIWHIRFINIPTSLTVYFLLIS